MQNSLPPNDGDTPLNGVHTDPLNLSSLEIKIAFKENKERIIRENFDTHIYDTEDKFNSLTYFISRILFELSNINTCGNFIRYTINTWFPDFLADFNKENLNSIFLKIISNFITVEKVEISDNKHFLTVTMKK